MVNNHKFSTFLETLGSMVEPNALYLHNNAIQSSGLPIVHSVLCFFLNIGF